ncbi:MAG: sugar ABC transporter permease [Acidobacteria bacterium]|nr:sugar ABC transporter permease [Acidobacteriota bacterium]
MTRPARAEARLGWLLVSPALGLILLVSLGPILATTWEALHGHDLRLPWLGRPFIGLANFVEAAGDPRFLAALARTVAFAAVSVPIELALGLALALVMHATVRGRALVRVAALLPWAIPTVVAALIWRFIFDAQAGILTASLRDLGAIDAAFDWLVHPVAAWVPIIGADVWKTTPFVAILLLAGLQTIDPALDEAARIDGAGAVRRFATITLPLVGPALVVAAAFRTLDALRLFDLAYVLTGGGPGTATEPLSLYAFIALMQRLRFGYGSALSVTVFLLTFACALIWVRALGRLDRYAAPNEDSGPVAGPHSGPSKGI